MGCVPDVKRSNNCELTTLVREKITPSHTARFDKSPSRSVACSVCWLPSWRPHRSITDNRDSSFAMEALPATDCSFICLLFINDLLGILSDSTATHMVHFYMSLLVSCINTLALVFSVYNLALKHCWIQSDKYIPNTCNGSHNSILKKLQEYRKSSIKPPGGLFFLIERGGLFNLAKRVTCSKKTVVWDRVDLSIVQLKSLSKVFNSLLGT